ncbi:MAG: hypothetical protein R8M14_02160 [Ghiorsea sp.]
MNTSILNTVRYGLILGVFSLILGSSWAVYMATHHEQLHGGFEAQAAKQQQAHAKADMETMMQDMGMGDMLMGEATSGTHSHHDSANETEPHQHQESAGHAHQAGHQHSHSGSLATDAMQRLVRGHIHAMGLGVLVCVLLLVVALTSLKDVWKKTLGWSFGLGAVLYPPAWIIMGFRTVELGPEAAEVSIMWLFGPAVGLLFGSMVALLIALMVEAMDCQRHKVFSFLFQYEEK